MVVTLQNWIHLDIVGIVCGVLQRVTLVDHVRQRSMDIRMNPQDQTL